MRNAIKIAASALCALMVLGCSDGDKMEYGKSALVMTGTEREPLKTFAVDADIPSTLTYPLTVSATSRVDKETTIKLKVDNSLVEKYNAANKTTFAALDEEAIDFSENTVVIEKGLAVSTAANITITKPEMMDNSLVYMIPVTIESAHGSFDVLEAGRTIYLRISNTFQFMSLNIGNANISSNFIFNDDQAVELLNYTYEVKCYPASLGNRAGNINRLCSWTSKDESRSLMLRFNENGQPVNSLQAVCPGGNLISSTIFEAGQWYMLSFTFDGTTMRMYVNGNADIEAPHDGWNTFQRLELGMSWGGYTSSQLFNGRISEMRVWNRPLTAGQIKLGMCGVDPASEGLVAYWKFNEGSGHIFHDATGHGYDIDWSQTVRDTSENGVLVATPNAATYVERNWVQDSQNKCTN